MRILGLVGRVVYSVLLGGEYGVMKSKTWDTQIIM